MRILHTSDWHLGASLAGRKRYDEAEAFFDWLIGTITRERVETLIIAGDVFDSGNPSNRALELYYRFLGRTARSGCRHIVVTAGNHDSPSLLAAPRELLSALDIHVVGAIPDTPAEEVFILSDDADNPALIVCAVPFLRDRDIRIAEAGESIEEKRIRLITGISDHYREVCTIAESHRQKLGRHIPIIATGHLFVAGGSTIADDGVRDLSVGSLIQVGADLFPPCIDYLALGHLHQPQLVGGQASRRYSGAPFTMGFGESDRDKVVVVVDFAPEGVVTTTPVIVPRLRRFVQIRGNTDDIREKLSEMRFSGRPAWVEVLLEDPGAGPLVRDELYRFVEGSVVEVLKVKITGPGAASLYQQHESLEDLNPVEVFKRCLETGDEPEKNREDLMILYREILAEVLEGDLHAE